MIPLRSPRGGTPVGDPVSAPHVVSPRPAPHQGWLLKKGGVRKNWKRRLFVLEEGVMKYYAVDKAKNREQKGSFTVRDVSCGPGKKYNSAFQVQTGKRTWFMIAESVEDFVLWQRVSSLAQRFLTLLCLISIYSCLTRLEQTLNSATTARLEISGRPGTKEAGTAVRKNSFTHQQSIDTILLSDAFKAPLLTLHMKYVGCGGEVYLNGKLISHYKSSAVVNRHIACINQWVLFEEPPNTLAAIFKYPDMDYFTDVLPKLTIQFMVRDSSDETWISVGHKIRFTLSTANRDPVVVVLPDREKTDEILAISRVSRKKARTYLSFMMKFSVFGTPYPLWSWAHAETFAAGVESSALRLEVFEATYAIYRMFVERRDADLKAAFMPLLRDLAHTTQRLAICNGDEGRAVYELWQSCFLRWIEEPNYKLTHMSKKDKEYRIATCGRFVTLVTPKNDWPIIFTSKHQKNNVPDIPVNFVFVKVSGRLRTTMFWQGPFP